MRAPSEQLLDSLLVGLLWLDADLRVVYRNAAAQDLLTLSGRAAAGNTLPELLPEAGELHALLRQACGKRQGYTQPELVIPLGPDKHDPITVSCTITPVTADHDEQPMLSVELSPLDRHRHISKEEKLAAQHQAGKSLVRGLAHEIKNPLGGLRGAAQLLEAELPESELREYTRVIIAEADRLSALVDALLGPARRPEPADVNVHELLEHVVRLLAAEYEVKVKFVRDYDPSLPELLLDRDQIIQVFFNIMKNACQAFTTRGEIILRTRAERQYTIGQTLHRLVARIDVQDNGPGIAEEIQDNLFFPLVSGRPQGSGLGLSIAQDIINRHAGAIEWESRPGATIFSVYLPLEHNNANT
ncbi:MAG: nitrogen regulation protein NR(II) [Gammaproteobacteria bacterium]|nr:nitrogen regulation protein NR(II) [Gammaproteobacteria bacterium]